MSEGIIQKEMQDHDKHYRMACIFAACQVKRRGQYYKREPWVVLKDMFGHGSTVSTAIWNKYKPEPTK